MKFKLESFRAAVQREVETRTGVRLRVGSVQVNGLRGLRIENTSLTLDLPGGPVLELTTPVAYVNIDIIDLLYGDVTIERVQIDESLIRVNRQAGRQWMMRPEGAESDSDEAFGLPATPSFRVVGRNCKLEILSAADRARLVVGDFAFDVSRLPGSSDIAAKLTGKLGAEEKDTELDVRFTSVEDFDLRAYCEHLTASEVSVFVPASDRFVRSGRASPTIRVSGYPGGTLVLGLEAPFEDFSVQNQPEFLRPASGHLSAVASYDLSTRVLALTSATAETEQLGGRLDGSIAFSGEVPAFDLRFEATQLPVTEIIDYVVQGRASEYATLDLKLQDPSQVEMRLRGTPDAPVVSTDVAISGGEFSFVPQNKRLPAGTLQLGSMTLSWNSQSQAPSGSFTVTGGTLTDGFSGMKADKVSGVLTVENTKIGVDPLNAEVTGNPFVGSLQYDFETGEAEFAANGALAEIEKTVFGSAAKDLSLSGALSFRCRGSKTSKKYAIDAEFDATQAEIGFEWWFLKPQGVGATGKNIHIEVLPFRTIAITGDAVLATSPIAVTANVVHNKKKWRLESVECTSDNLDVVAIDKCLRIPYKVAGGLGINASYEWTRKDLHTDGWEMRIDGDLDEVALTPDGSEAPLVCEGLHVNVYVDKSPEPKGIADIEAKRAIMPALGETWFVPLRRPPKDGEDGEDHPSDNRSWTVALAAESIEVLPWKGANFTGQAYNNSSVSGLRSFEGEVEGGGRISGAFRSEKEHNTYEAAYKWDGIPAHYLLEQLDFSSIILAGTASGGIDYSMDRDDPNTLKGRGNFEIRDGQFSADFIFSKLSETSGEEGMSALPPSLAFSQLRSDIILEGDLVKTPNFQLVSEGITLAGSGQFITDGDMDYDVKLAIAPDVAERIQLLRDNFNVQGLRLAQQDIELAFKIHGPTFKPKGEVSELPSVAVHLVSGALEVTTDAIKVIDLPRKILVDLLKIGGGIVGASK